MLDGPGCATMTGASRFRVGRAARGHGRRSAAGQSLSRQAEIGYGFYRPAWQDASQPESRAQKGEERVEEAKRSDFVGRHLIIDASTTNRRNLTSTDTVFTLLEALARNLDMTLVLP